MVKSIVNLAIIGISLCCVVLADDEPGEFGQMRSGTVTAEILNVRALPGTNYEVICRLEQGERVQVLGEKAEWLEIVAPARADAWCADRLLDDEGRAVTDDVRVRAGAGVVFSYYATLAEGEMVELKGVSERGWQRIAPPAHATGWTSRKYIALDPAPVPPQRADSDPEPDENGDHPVIDQSLPVAGEDTDFQAPIKESLPGAGEQTGLQAPIEISAADDSATQVVTVLPPVKEEEEEVVVEEVEEDAETRDIVEEEELAPLLDPNADTTFEDPPQLVGVLLSLKDRKTAFATHLLGQLEGRRVRPLCYLRSEHLNLTEWEYQTVRVYGKEVMYSGWRLPVVLVNGLQLQSP